jgi:hypothetical protein
MPVDPATSPAYRPMGEVILKDRPCLKCGYNLRGLETGGACPECGSPITSRKKSVRFADHLVDAPLSYIKRIAASLFAMAAVIIGWVVFWVVSGVSGFAPAAEGLVATLLAAVWCGAVWGVTAPRPMGDRTVRDDILDSPRIRLIARGAQGFGLAAAASGALAGITGWVLFEVLSGLLMLAALAGVVPLGVYLSSLADWAGDTGVGSRLRAAVWCVAVCGTLLVAALLAVLIPTPLRGVLAFAGTVLSVIVAIGFVLFCVAILQLSLSAVWAIQNWVEARDREMRMEEKRRRRAAADAARADEALAALDRANEARESARADLPESIPLSAGEDGAPTPAIKHSAPLKTPPPRGVVPAKEVSPYDLAPDDDGEGTG